MTLGLMLNKPLAKAVLDTRGIKTPAYVVVDRGKDLVAANRLAFPLIVKPAAEDASIGIDDGAVVHDAAALAERCASCGVSFPSPRSSRVHLRPRIQRLGSCRRPLRIPVLGDRRDRL